MSGRRALVLAALLVAAGAAAALLASGQPWWVYEQQQEGLPARTWEQTGDLGPVALVALAALPVAVLLPPRWRWPVGLLWLALGALLAGSGRAALDDRALLPAGLDPAGGWTAQRTGWPVAGLVAGVAVLVGGAVATATAHRWPVPSRRDGAGAPGRTPPAPDRRTERDVWDALDRGEDPTRDER